MATLSNVDRGSSATTRISRGRLYGVSSSSQRWAAAATDTSSPGRAVTKATGTSPSIGSGRLTTAAALTDEVERYNAAVDGPCWLGRAAPRRRLHPPYYAPAVSSGLVHTQGGMTIDTAARVVRPGGDPIPGLFAAGGAAAGISGDGPDTYLPGNGLAHAFVTGLVAAETVAAAFA